MLEQQDKCYANGDTGIGEVENVWKKFHISSMYDGYPIGKVAAKDREIEHIHYASMK